MSLRNLLKIAGDVIEFGGTSYRFFNETQDGTFFLKTVKNIFSKKLLKKTTQESDEKVFKWCLETPEELFEHIEEYYVILICRKLSFRDIIVEFLCLAKN